MRCAAGHCRLVEGILAIKGRGGCQDSKVNVFVANCEKLCLVSEAETLAELQQRIIDVVPELIELNHVPIKSNSFTLNFNKGISI